MTLQTYQNQTLRKVIKVTFKIMITHNGYYTIILKSIKEGKIKIPQQYETPELFVILKEKENEVKVKFIVNAEIFNDDYLKSLRNAIKELTYLLKKYKVLHSIFTLWLWELAVEINYANEITYVTFKFDGKTYKAMFP